MRAICVITVTWLALGACATACAAEAVGVNVKEFGAKGDGKTDDTEAIQKALDAAGKPRASRQISVYLATCPEVVFPAGHYKVSKTLKPGAYQRLRGDGGKVMLEQTDSEAATFEAMGYRNMFEGLAFIGGHNAIRLNTNNADTSMPKIADCQFYASTGSAIAFEGASSLLSIDDCLFINCEQVMDCRADMAVMRNCWISTRSEMRDKAVIVNRGVLHLEDVLGVPRTNGSDQRWIDNYGTVRAVRVRFGGEGAGFTPVVNFAKFDASYPVWPSSVTLQQCYVYALGNKQRKCAVYCEEIPNSITIHDCSGFIDMAMVMVNPEIAENPDYFKEAHPSQLHYGLRGNVTDTLERFPIPEIMAPYSRSD
ncbi:MAG: glycosyl hydrolase family 28-related protein [Candidatus Hydrogenedentota bacterium]